MNYLVVLNGLQHPVERKAGHKDVTKTSHGTFEEAI